MQHFCGQYLSAEPTLRCQAPNGVTLTVHDPNALRELTLPPGADSYSTPILESYRAWAPPGGNSVLHNPTNDKRTTKGVNHVVDAGLPVPNDKIAISPKAFAKMWELAQNPPQDQAVIPFTVDPQVGTASGIPGMTKILIHPVMVPEIPGVQEAKRAEILFVAPGGATIANLDFTARVFGLAGDPQNPENDLSWQIEQRAGLTGCVIIAPHLVGMRSKDLGLPHKDEATERQIKDGFYWESEGDLYNKGKPFKASLRGPCGEVVTIIADNYLGYCKKEVMTQLSFGCNITGEAEIEHSGGAYIARCANLGRAHIPSEAVLRDAPTLHSIASRLPEIMTQQREGFATDNRFPEKIIYVPKTAQFDRDTARVTWSEELDATGKVVTPAGSLPLKPGILYTAPNGFTVSLTSDLIDGHEITTLVGRMPDSLLFHKPSTVSGGGKSELAKPTNFLVRSEQFALTDPESDLDFAEMLCGEEGLNRIRSHRRDGSDDDRGILDPRRTVGSLIKLLTPSELHSDKFNQWLHDNVPPHRLDLLCIIKQQLPANKRVRDLFFTAQRDGVASKHLRMHTPDGGSIGVDQQLLRVGWSESEPRFFTRRPGNTGDAKLQILDDITAATTVPAELLRQQGFTIPNQVTGVKFVQNCEHRLFQRPDDAKLPGADPLAEAHFAQDKNGFYVNYEPLTKEQVQAIVDNSELLAKYHPSMQAAMRDFLASPYKFFACSSHPRLIDGKHTSNPRFLQIRPDHANSLPYYHNDITRRLSTGVPPVENRPPALQNNRPLPRWVNINLPAHRLAPADPSSGLPTTAIWSPLHHLSGPAAVAKMICSFTPKSRAAAGFGDEGALTKGPFNSMLAVLDLNAAVISMILNHTPTFITGAGFIGPNYEVDHDMTYLIPGILGRMKANELDPEYLHDNGFMARVPDFVEAETRIPTAILGSRFTEAGIIQFGARVFLHPDKIFPPHMLYPEQQDHAQFKDGLLALLRAYKAAAESLKQDGSYAYAIPPVQRTIDLMARGDGLGFDNPELMSMFTTRALLAEGSYYHGFLKERQRRELAELDRNNPRGASARIQELLKRSGLTSAQIAALKRGEDAIAARRELVNSAGYVNSLIGTIGTDPAIATMARH